MNGKKMNMYVRLGLHMLLGALFGGVLGWGFFWIFGNVEGGTEVLLTSVLIWAQRLILPSLIVITIGSVLIGEVTCRKLKKICSELLNAEDKEADVWMISSICYTHSCVKMKGKRAGKIRE